MSAGYEVVLAFDTDDPQFVRGFEAGRLWERIKGRSGDVGSDGSCDERGDGDADVRVGGPPVQRRHGD
jgi:hypothetical protein